MVGLVEWDEINEKLEYHTLKKMEKKETKKNNLTDLIGICDDEDEDEDEQIANTRKITKRNYKLTQDEYNYLIFCINKHPSGKLKFDRNELKNKIWRMSD
jgi:hypothetical protein